MAHTSSPIQTLDALLAQPPQHYSDPYRVRNDVANLLHTSSTFTPHKTPIYRGNSSLMLIVLDGTVPITFKGQRYNIPVIIEISEQYPYHPPNVRVNPMATMIVVPNHPYVDSQCRVVVPTIAQWNPQCTLVQLFHEIQNAFTALPPLRAKIQSAPPPSYRQTNPPPPYQPPSQPSNPIPPYLSSSNNLPSSRPPRNSANPPPYTPPLSNSHRSNDSFNEADATKAAERNLRRSIEQVVMEKIAQKQSRVSKDMEEATRENDKLNLQFKKLEEENRSVKLELERRRSEWESVKAQLENANAQLKLLEDREREKDASRDQTDVIDQCLPQDPLTLQQMTLVAEDRAIEDTQYYLDKALQNGLTDLATYIKETRRLSALQFQKRALLNLIETEKNNPKDWTI